MSKDIVIYHNPRCGKSRNAKTAAESTGMNCSIVEYLHSNLTAGDIKDLLKKLNKKPLEVIRTKEEVFKQKFSNKNLSDQEWIQAIVDNPILLERPIIVRGNKAWIARDEEAVKTALNG